MSRLPQRSPALLLTGQRLMPPGPGLGGGWGPGRPADSWAAAVTAGTMQVSTERTAGPQVALPGEKGPAR